MSDLLERIEKIRIKQRLLIADPSEIFLRRASSENISLTLKISNNALKELAAIKRVNPQLLIIEILNANINSFLINTNCSRLENRFGALLQTFKYDWKKKIRCGELARKSFLNCYRKVHIFSDEVTNVSKLAEDVSQLRTHTVGNKAKEETLFEALQHCTCVENKEFVNKGNIYDNVSTKQKKRKKDEIREHTNIAMWFAKSYGLELKSMEFKLPLSSIQLLPSRHSKLPSLLAMCLGS